ncbi:hypothetical protein [Arthrobacter sp. H16F315]|uniref:hypothetical protein n=1 Tax=Arthrobacter sp. H16F315 TaxID=2955314 RepID=UPI00209706C7|nr:hypothetical protein [Arthrobacter sp. H16F315]MDD1476158.1 hypothetical protein [Arthrobacter sp. H16F315]
MTIASTTPRPRGANHRREVTAMKKKLQRLLQLSLSPGARRKTQFNGPLLDQKREDVFLTMHRIGFIR